MSKRWFEVATTRDIDDEEVIQVEANGCFMALYKLNGRFYATTDHCVCNDGHLSDGFVEEEQVYCAACDTGFDIRSGRADSDADSSVKRYPVKIDNGLVYVGINTDTQEQ